MIKVTKQQMINYIFAQPDDRMVNFSENLTNQDCGCVMVHYGKDNDLKFNGCGFARWEYGGRCIAAMEDCRFNQFQPSEDRDEYTYSELKEFLRQKDWLPTEGNEDA